MTRPSPSVVTSKTSFPSLTPTPQTVRGALPATLTTQLVSNGASNDAATFCASRSAEAGGAPAARVPRRAFHGSAAKNRSFASRGRSSSTDGKRCTISTTSRTARVASSSATCWTTGCVPRSASTLSNAPAWGVPSSTTCAPGRRQSSPQTASAVAGIAATARTSRPPIPCATMRTGAFVLSSARLTSSRNARAFTLTDCRQS